MGRSDVVLPEIRENPHEAYPVSTLNRLAYGAALIVAGERQMFRRLREFSDAERRPPELLRARQNGRIHRILTYAARNVAFYRDAWRGERIPEGSDVRAFLEGLPLISKRDLQRNFESLRAFPRSSRTTRKTTGGSTGEPVTVIKDRSATAAERAAMWCAYGWHGIAVADRAVRFWGTAERANRNHRLDAVSDRLMNRIRVSAFAFSEDDLGQYWEKCLSFGPVYFHGYVSMLEMFARFVNRNGLPGDALGLKAVIATSEALAEPVRAEIERAFGAPVRGEYGSGEIGSVAFECENASYHVMSENVLVEILRPDGTPAPPGERGEIVLTDLNNRALPLIRYRIGDLGSYGGRCSCGRTFPILSSIVGRAYDFVVTPDGRRYHGEFFMYLFEDLRKSGLRIEQFQIIQRQTDEIRVRIVVPDVDSRAELLVVTELSSRLTGVRVIAERVRSIERAPSGKMQVIKRLANIEL